MIVDPHENEYFVIRQGGVFLRGMYAGNQVTRWSYSAYEAWSIKSRTLAESVQKKVGGEVVKFNALTGEVWNI